MCYNIWVVASKNVSATVMSTKMYLCTWFLYVCYKKMNLYQLQYSNMEYLHTYQMTSVKKEWAEKLLNLFW
jgi:hypothetical protein